MLRKIKIYKGGTAMFGKRVAKSGFVGEVDILENAVTITLIKPGANLEDAKRSLEITIQDMDLRMKQEKNNPLKEGGKQDG